MNEKQLIKEAKHVIRKFGREDLSPSVKVGKRLWVLNWEGCFFYKCVNPTSDMTFYFADVVGAKSLRRSKLASISTIQEIKALGKEIGRTHILSR
jgi:hypothetical protein